jgi:hypothetical protein
MNPTPTLSPAFALLSAEKTSSDWPKNTTNLVKTHPRTVEVRQTVKQTEESLRQLKQT